MQLLNPETLALSFEYLAHKHRWLLDLGFGLRLELRKLGNLL
jgi:hypothetical protein